MPVRPLTKFSEKGAVTIELEAKLNVGLVSESGREKSSQAEENRPEPFRPLTTSHQANV